MPIIRQDKRQGIINGLEGVHLLIREILFQIDFLQHSVEELQVDLGIGSETSKYSHDQFIVMHYKGTDKPHQLVDCTDECNIDDTLDVLAEKDEPVENELPKDEP
jgi:hypothetical protein